MTFKKLLSTVIAMTIVSAIGANAFALDKSVTVYKNIVNNEFYTGMGAHSAKAFSNGIVVNNNTDLKLERVKTKKIYVGIFGGYIYELKYYSGQAKIKVVGIPHGEKHVDLEINN